MKAGEPQGKTWCLPGTLAQKGLLIIGLPAALQLVFFGTLMVENWQLQRSAAVESHYRRLLTTVGSMALDSIQVCSQLNNLMSKPNVASLVTVKAFIVKLNQETTELTHDAEEDPETNAICQSFVSTSRELQDIFKNCTEILMRGLDRDSACDLFIYRERFQLVVPRFLQQHQLLLQQSLILSQRATSARERQRSIQGYLISGGAVSCALLAVIVGYFFSREIRSRLAVIRDNTKLLGTNRPLLPPIEGQDEIKELDRTFREMASALAAAKEKERALVTESQDMICSLDVDGKITLFNPATLQIFSVADHELAGELFVELCAASSRSAVQDALTAARESTQQVEAMIESEGKQRFLSCVINWSAQQEQFFVAAHDITRRKQLEQMQRELYAMIAHDVRSPLMSAKAAIELSLIGIPDNETRLKRAEHSIDRVTHLINDLLDMEKLQAGKFEIYPDRITCKNVVASAVDSVHGLIEAKKLKLVESVVDAELYADRELLARVVFNLLSNAVKFSPPEATIYVTCQLDAGELRFSVRDQGPGISREAQLRLFEKFVQLEDKHRTHKGTGLGLAICKMIVEEHDGRIGVTSDGSSGSEFWFTVPALEILSQDTPATSPMVAT